MASLDKQFQRVRTAIVGRRLTDLPSARLAGIEDHLTQQAREILAELEQIEREADEAIAGCDWPRFDGLRVRAIELSDRFEETRELTKKVDDARHERLLEERLVARFGSARAVMIWDFVIMGLIVLVVSLLSYQALIGVDDRTALIFDVIDVAACLVFFVDLSFRFRAAESARWFFRRYWLDVLTSIPIPTSLLRAGRVIRLARLARMVRLVRLLRVIRAILFFWRGMDKLAATLDVKLMRRSLNILVVVLLVGGVCIWWVEGSARGVEDLSQGLWWSFTTVVTGGFGDIYNPSTVVGRLLTVLLVIAGMVVVGMFTATLTSVLVREEDATAAILSFEEGVHEELGRIRAQLAQLGADQGAERGAERGETEAPDRE